MLAFLYIRGATATKASKARALPIFGLQLTLSQPGGADYAHYSTMGLVWLKFAVAPLFTWSKQREAHLVLERPIKQTKTNLIATS